MKIALLLLAVLLICLACESPMFAAAKFDESQNSKYKQDLFIAKKRQNQGFLKRAWQTLFPKSQLCQKPSYKETRLNFGGWALIAISLAVIALFIHWFWAFAIIAWAASMVLGVIGLFKDERKVLAVIALSLALALPVFIIILFYHYCCGP